MKGILLLSPAALRTGLSKPPRAPLLPACLQLSVWSQSSAAGILYLNSCMQTVQAAIH